MYLTPAKLLKDRTPEDRYHAFSFFSVLKGTAYFNKSSAYTKLSLLTLENYRYMRELISNSYSILDMSIVP